MELTTNDILADAMKVIPPMRPDELGVSYAEMHEIGMSSKKTFREYVDKKGFVSVSMRVGGKRQQDVIYMPPEQAAKYSDWIVHID